MKGLLFGRKKKWSHEQTSNNGSKGILWHGTSFNEPLVEWIIIIIIICRIAAGRLGGERVENKEGGRAPDNRNNAEEMEKTATVSSYRFCRVRRLRERERERWKKRKKENRRQ